MAVKLFVGLKMRSDKMNLKTKRTICLLVAIASVLTIVGSVSYAYFTAIGEVSSLDAKLDTANVSVTFRDNDLGLSAVLNIDESVTKKFTIENTGTVDASVKMYFDEMINTYTEGSLTYTLFYSETSEGPYTEVVSTKNVPVSSARVRKTLANELMIPLGKTYYYNLEVTFNHLKDENQDKDLEAIFNTKFKVVDIKETEKRTLIFDAGEGTADMENLTVIDGEPYGDLPEATMYGYNFLGWFTAREGGIQITSDTIVNLASSQNLYAKFEPKIINVTLDARDGYLDNDRNLHKKVIQVRYGDTYGELPIAKGMGECKYDSIGWSLTGLEKDIIPKDAKITNAEDHVLYAFAPSPACFLKGTLIYTPNGYVPIEDLKVGEEVYSYNEKTKEIEISKLTQVFIRQATNYMKVTLKTGTVIYVTPEHPFYDKETETWKPIKASKVGDKFMDEEGNEIEIASIEENEKEVTVYNLEVDGNHDYFVSKDNILVHNKLVC